MCIILHSVSLYFYLLVDSCSLIFVSFYKNEIDNREDKSITPGFYNVTLLPVPTV
jgi:hypothetical protein